MSNQTSTERWSIAILALGVVLLLVLSRVHHAHPPASSAAAESNLVPLPSAPPTPATIAELQARNKGLHWTSIAPQTVMILTATGSCGTLTGLAPAQISFHTGRAFDREPHLYSAWSDAYTAAEQYCASWAAEQQRAPSP